MELNEKQLMKLIRESIIKTLNEESKLDKYGNEIPKNGQGYGVDPELRNRQGYNADGSKGPWFSRSVACATAVLLNDNGVWYVLAGQRGSGTPDYQGYWNLPCGYLDYNEDTKEGAVREVREETGIKLNLSDVIEMGHSSSPNENRQNVCFFYASVLRGNIEDYPFSKAEMEENEVDGLQWVPLEEVDNFKWAFDHDVVLNKIVSNLGNQIHNGKTDKYNAYSCIDHAIQLIKNNGDTNEIINILEQAKYQIKQQ